MKNYYTGYEGEAEVVFSLKSDGVPRRELRMWAGYFRSIMASAQPVNGMWTGLALPYNADDKWDSGEPWKIVNLTECVEQWKTLSTSGLSKECGEIHALVLELMMDALQDGAELWVSEDS